LKIATGWAPSQPLDTIFMARGWTPAHDGCAQDDIALLATSGR